MIMLVDGSPTMLLLRLNYRALSWGALQSHDEVLYLPDESPGVVDMWHSSHQQQPD